MARARDEFDARRADAELWCEGKRIAARAGLLAYLAQLAVPLATALYLLLRQRDYFGFAVGSGWLAFSEWELGTYIFDAPREELPLVGFGGQPDHDWATLLTRWQLLNNSDHIAFIVRALALVTWAGAIAFGGWLCWRIWRHSRGHGGRFAQR